MSTSIYPSVDRNSDSGSQVPKWFAWQSNRSLQLLLLTLVTLSAFYARTSLWPLQRYLTAVQGGWELFRGHWQSIGESTRRFVISIGVPAGGSNLTNLVWMSVICLLPSFALVYAIHKHGKSVVENRR